jgi:hypothetical protein
MITIEFSKIFFVSGNDRSVKENLSGIFGWARVAQKGHTFFVNTGLSPDAARLLLTAKYGPFNRYVSKNSERQNALYICPQPDSKLN